MSTALETPHFPRSPFSASVRTWWTMLRISLEERLVYRGDFMLGTLMRFLPLVTQIFLWTAVFSAISGKVLVGYTLNEMIAYLLLTNVSRAFSSMPALASGISRSILDGSIKKYLIQPVDMVGFLLITRVAHKLVYYTVATIPFALVFFVCQGFFTSGWPAPQILAAFVLSLVLAFVLGFFFEACLGMIGFWFLEVNSLLFVYMLFNYFLSGQMFPLELLDKIMLPGAVSLGALVRLLPLQYLCYFPCAVFLGKITGAALIRGLLVELGWVAFFVFASRWLFNRGVRRYSAFGG
ncbi:MAG TPA: ABC-2 family transporter protein [Pirellulales bacterium]|jgi:ABC-2 type transport system permease protein|nr:ABC-2 family transporter protein [Pirellulales bacterium]